MRVSSRSPKEPPTTPEPEALDAEAVEFPEGEVNEDGDYFVRLDDEAEAVRVCRAAREDGRTCAPSTIKWCSASRGRILLSPASGRASVREPVRPCVSLVTDGGSG